MSDLLEHIAFLLGFLTFCVVVLGGIAVFHHGRLALMDHMTTEQERQRRRQNANIIPLDPNAIPHTIERWHY